MTSATQKARQAFQQFTGGELDKWSMYATIFALMDARAITLQALCSIAPDYGITAGAIEMRRIDWLAMK